MNPSALKREHPTLQNIKFALLDPDPLNIFFTTSPKKILTSFRIKDFN
jgi:hypothetical protein